MAAAVGRPVNRILVAGPPVSGVSAVVAALSAALPAHRVKEWSGGRVDDPPGVIVFVTTAAAPMTPSQAGLLDAVLAVTGPVPVVGAVSKIDLHRGWTAVLAANRGLRPTRWVGVAADPDIGAPRLDDLADAVRDRHRPSSPARGSVPARHPGRAAAILGRAEVAQARLRLNGWIRTGCAELLADLHGRAGALDRRGLEAFGERALARVGDAAAGWDEAVTEEFASIVRDCGLDADAIPPEPPPEVPARPVPRPDPTEARLTVLIGVVFGIGTALSVDRLLGEFVPRWPVAVPAAAGLALGLWVIRSRRLIAQRFALRRWSAEVLAGARAMLEQRVASRALAVEVALGLALASPGASRRSPGLD